jgi:hypothetical protein
MPDNAVNGLSSNKDIAGVTGVNTAGTNTAPDPQGDGGFGVFGRGDGPRGTGIVGMSSTSHGVHGINGAGNPKSAPIIAAGVWGETDNGFGVFGNSLNNNGVHGDSTNADGVVGTAHAQGKSGVLGITQDVAFAGVTGVSSISHGVHGINGAGANPKPDKGAGVWGESDFGVGVVGVSGQIGIIGQGGVLAARFVGNVEVTGDITLANADCAEDFDIATGASAQAGTVMVLSDEGTLHQSYQAYDKRVAGVISGAGGYQPGLILDKHSEKDNRVPLALMGKVYCKVDAQYAGVEVGDLLTTSPTRGHAMKAVEPQRSFGAVIGKALRPLRAGQGMIPILVALQ